MNAVLVADSIGKSYGRRKVLVGAFLSASPGEVVALMGRNGSGKSTLLQICAGWLGADHGWVQIRGHRFFRPSPTAMAAAGICYLPVDRVSLSPGFTLGAHLDVVETLIGPVARAPTLEHFGIAHLERTKCRALSGGERRRAEMAIAFLRRPDCLLLDEPFHGIDPHDTERIGSALRSLAAAGSAVVITGHEAADMLTYADRVVWLDGGTTEDLGTPDDSAGHWRFRRDYLGRAPVRPVPIPHRKPDDAHPIAPAVADMEL